MTKAVNKASSIKAPRIPAELEDFRTSLFVNDENYEDTLFSNFVWENSFAGNIKLSTSRLVGCNLTLSKISKSKIVDALFENCDLANARFDQSNIERVEFIKCRMTGFKGTESILSDVLFKDCQLKLSQFRMAKFKNVIFKNCILEEADFYQADLPGTIFRDCDLLKAEFSAAKLTKTDFRSSKLNGINVNIESMKGAIIEPSQLPYLAYLLGATIEWLPENEATF